MRKARCERLAVPRAHVAVPRQPLPSSGARGHGAPRRLVLAAAHELPPHPPPGAGLGGGSARLAWRGEPRSGRRAAAVDASHGQSGGGLGEDSLPRHVLRSHADAPASLQALAMRVDESRANGIFARIADGARGAHSAVARLHRAAGNVTDNERWALGHDEEEIGRVGKPPARGADSDGHGHIDDCVADSHHRCLRRRRKRLDVKLRSSLLGRIEWPCLVEWIWLWATGIGLYAALDAALAASLHGAAAARRVWQ